MKIFLNIHKVYDVYHHLPYSIVLYMTLMVVEYRVRHRGIGSNIILPLHESLEMRMMEMIFEDGVESLEVTIHARKMKVV